MCEKQVSLLSKYHLVTGMYMNPMFYSMQFYTFTLPQKLNKNDITRVLKEYLLQFDHFVCLDMT